jgi:hypothetical protein
MDIIAPAYPRPRRSPGWALKHLIAPLLVSAAISIGSYALGLGRSQAVDAARLARVESDAAALERDKVSKDQFVEFQKSIEDLKGEVREMRKDLNANTREMLRRAR